MIHKDGIVFTLDTPEPVPLNSREYYLKGWCVAGSSVDGLRIAVLVDGVEQAAFFGLPRPDVAAYFKLPSVTRCGFIARFQLGAASGPVTPVAILHGKRIPLTGPITIPAQEMPEGSKVTNYQHWLALKESDLFWKEEEIPRRLAALDYRPLISVILPTYNTPNYFLLRCLESVVGQHYRNWELCAADDKSSDPEVLETLHKFAAADSRIKVVQSERQGGISAASNIALKHAGGDFIVLLDHDDELHPFALLEMVRAFNESPRSHFFYSDEDKINEYGVRCQPSFKPDFDRNTFLSQNYLGHLIALRRSLVTEIGGFRSSCDGAQDWDLLLRASEIVDQATIRHVRKPLYHWRMHDNSTASNLDCKPYVAKAWGRVLNDHVARTGQAVSVSEGLFHGSMRLCYPAPRNLEVGVFLRTMDGAFQSAFVKMNAARRALHIYQLSGCAVSRIPSGYLNGSASALRASPCSLTELSGDVFVFINGKLESLNHHFFEELVSQSMRKDCGLATGIAVDSENNIISTGLVRSSDNHLMDPCLGVKMPSHGYLGQASLVRCVDACPETFFAVRREHLEAVGGLGVVSSSEIRHLATILTQYLQDKGLSLIFTPYAVASFSPAEEPAKERTLQSTKQETLRVNPALLSFVNSDQVLKGHAC